jgi:dipeptidase D
LAVQAASKRLRDVKFKLRPASAGSAWRIKVSGLKGGHSGVDIHQGRGNALRIMGGVLQVLLDKIPIEIAEVNGGSAQNAIPREAAALVLVDPSREKELKSLVATPKLDTKLTWGDSIPDCRSRSRRRTAGKSVGCD